MKKLLLSIVSVFMIFSLSAQITDNFSDYTVGGKLAQQAQAMDRAYWTTWSLAPGGNEDGVIAEMPAGNKCLNLYAPNHDQILRLGNKNGSTWQSLTTGAYELTFKVYIPTGKDGYFNIKSVFPSTVSETWAMQIYLGCDEEEVSTPGLGIIYGGASFGTNFSITHDTWIPIKIFIDLDVDVAEFYVNDAFVHTFQYSKGSFGNSNHKFIDALNIFPPGTAATSNFYIDDINFVSVGGDTEILHETSFDDVASGSYVAQSYPTWWTTWGNNPGTGEDALITNEQFQTPGNSAKLSYSTGSDLVFKAGNKTTGKYFIDFDMYIPTGGSAFFNLLHIFNGFGSEWAVGVYFNTNGTDGMPVGTNVVNNNLNTAFTYPSATWFPINMTVDLDNDEANIKINNVGVLTWQFSLKESGGVGTRQLAAVDFYPPQTGSVYYIDNFVYSTTGGVKVPIMGVTPDKLEVVSGGEVITKTITVANTGTSMGEFSSWIEFDFEPPTGSNTFPISHCNYPKSGGLGYPNDCQLELGAKFSGEELCDKIGSYVTKMSYFLPNIGPTELIFRIYGPNTTNTTGEILMEFTKTSGINASDWNEIILPTPLLIDKNELWFTVEFFQPSGSGLIGVDEGPLKPGVNYTKRNGGAWLEFTQTEFGNFAIKAESHGGVHPACWLNLTGTNYGPVPAGATKNFDAVFNPAGLPNGDYEANIIVTTNDPTNPKFIIPCTFFVGDYSMIKPDINAIDKTITLPDEPGTVDPISIVITLTNSGNLTGEYTIAASTEGWLTFDGVLTDTIASGANATFTAIINPNGLVKGVYNTKISIQTENPSNPVVEIPCKLTVNVIDNIATFGLNSVSVYPNPAKGIATIESGTMINSIQLYNHLGQEVYSSTVTGDKTTINTSNFSAGLYFIRVNTEKGSQSVKLIVQ